MGKQLSMGTMVRMAGLVDTLQWQYVAQADRLGSLWHNHMITSCLWVYKKNNIQPFYNMSNKACGSPIFHSGWVKYSSYHCNYQCVSVINFVYLNEMKMMMLRRPLSLICLVNCHFFNFAALLGFCCCCCLFVYMIDFGVRNYLIMI